MKGNNNTGKILAISYGTPDFSMSLSLNAWSAKHIGKADNIKIYGPDALDKEYKERHSNILAQKRGGGYWLWKPYIILDALNEVNDEDYVIYTDAGLVYTGRISQMIELMDLDKQDIFLSLGFAPAKHWTKRDAFVLMGCDHEEAYNRVMVSGGYVIIRKTEKSLNFIKAWLKFGEDERIITDSPNQCGLDNLPGFHEHRHDQSILSNLAYLYKIDAYKAVSHVDLPRAHYDAIKHGRLGAYKYSVNERLALINIEHQYPGFNKAKYGRLFINTRLRNCNPILFMMKLIKRIATVLYIDIWGYFNDEKLLQSADNINS